MRRGVRRWFRLPVIDRLLTQADVDAELAAHLEARIERLMAEGMMEEQARGEAERRMGGLRAARTRLVDEAWSRDRSVSRRERAAAWLDDVRYAVRVLRRSPLFTGVAIGSLAIALALVTATTALVNAYLLRSMPYPHADRLYHVSYTTPGEPEPRGLSSFDWAALNAIVEHADSSAPSRLYIGTGADRREIQGLLAAPGTLELLGISPALGRSLHAEDFESGAEPVALIGHDLWRTRFGADSAILGARLDASRASGSGAAESFRIVGVLPENFRYAPTYVRGTLEFVVPVREELRVYMVRLKEGVPVAHAQQVIDAAVRRTGTWFPPGWRGVRLESVHDVYIDGVRPVLFAIAVAVAMVLVITCLNHAVLMLVRTLRGQKEWAMRVALGAGRGRLMRMHLVESALICGSALIVGLCTSMIALRTLEPLLEERLGREAPGATMAIAIDGRVLLIVISAAVLIAGLLAAVPLLAPWNRRLAATLRSAGRSLTDGAAARRVRSALLVLQVAASLALLAGCGLMLRTVQNLVRTDLGYKTEQIVRARIALPADRYTDDASFLRFYDQLAQQLAAAGARFALTTTIPFYEYNQQRIEVAGQESSTIDGASAAVSDPYFGLFGITLREGRGFTADDRPGREPVAIVSASLAARLGPGSAVGRRIRIEEGGTAASADWRTIVGVASDVRQTHTDSDLDDVYIPFAQAPSRYAPLYAETAQPSHEWLQQLRVQVAALDPLVLVTADPVSASLAVQEDRLLAGPRFLMSVLTGFALFAALLTALGVFGVTAYAVQQRERELAIRAAVGATQRQLILLFLRSAAGVLVLGLAAGLFGAATAGRLLRNQLHGVLPFDPVTLVCAAAFITITALLATWWPAARAGSSRKPLTVLNEG